MRYFRPAITNGILFLPLIALLLLTPYYWRYRRRGVNNPVKLLTFYSFVLYGMIAWLFVVLPLPSEAWLATVEPAGVNLLPFAYFRDLSDVTGFDVMQSDTWFSAVGSSFALQYWFNILLLLPMGIYLRYLFGLRAGKTALIVLLTTIFFEVAQLTGMFFWFSKPYRSFDVDDILCNFLGGMLGYWLMGRLLPLTECIERRAAGAYRSTGHVSSLRRSLAMAIDMQLVYVLHTLLKTLPGIRQAASELLLPMLFTEAFVYTTVCSMLFRGRTVGKWLLHIRVCSAEGGEVSRLRLLGRYAMLYSVLILLSLTPTLATLAGMPPAGVELLASVQTVLCVAAVGYYVIAAWMFPSRDYPWGVLSGTRAVTVPFASQNGQTS